MATVKTKRVDTIRHLSASIGATPKPRRESILLFIAITSSTKEERRRIIGLLAAQDFRYWHALPRRCVQSQREKVSLLSIGRDRRVWSWSRREVSSVRNSTLRGYPQIFGSVRLRNHPAGIQRLSTAVREQIQN